ncbi:major facilitator superfamily domain-containing protein [Chlamydoabsidia padenii]|nr:major facilitator superfamily domain-containing protein [Chlamydoabsidia padenii]
MSKSYETTMVGHCDHVYTKNEKIHMEPEEEKTSWMAWIVVGVVVAVNTSCAVMWLTASSLPTAFTDYMMISLTQLNWLSNISAIINTTFSLPSAWSYERFGLKTSILMSAILNTTGCWIRCLAIIVPEQHRFIMMMLGQIVASLGGPLIYNFFFSFSTFIPTQYLLLLVTAGFSAIVTIPAFFIPRKPRLPPSKSALEERMSFIQGIKQLIRNPTFRWIAFLASVDMGIAFSVSVLIIEAILPLGYSDQIAGVCASVVIFAGFAGGVIPNATGAVIIACLINGFFAYGIFPVMLEFCCEVTYPVPESISSCLIWSLVTAFMLVFSVMIDSLRAGPDANPPNNMTNSIIAMTVISAICFVPVFWLKGDLKRLAIDGGKQNSQDASDDQNAGNPVV